MAGNKNSGRKPKYKEEVKEIHFPLEKSYVEKLDQLALKFTNNNTSELLNNIVKRFIDSEFK